MHIFNAFINSYTEKKTIFPKTAEYHRVNTYSAELCATKETFNDKNSS